MTPLIDVIFLLLTFFIYSLLVMTPSRVLPVTLTALGSQQQGREAQANVITVNREGELYLNREAIGGEQLSAKLAEMAAAEDGSTLFLAVEEKGDVDRAPIVVGLIERVQAAGIRKFVIVGQPRDGGGG